MISEARYTVQQIVGDAAILAHQAEGHRVTVPTTRLPQGLTRDTVLRVPVDREGTPDWGRARIDAGDRAELLRELEERREAEPPRKTKRSRQTDKE